MSKAEETSRLIGGLIAAILLALFFAVAGVYINSVSNTPCAVLNNCTEIKLYMKVPLIATHLLPFALFPFAMLVFWLRAPQLERLKAISPFSSILGFAFFMVSMTGEIGWHVGQHWFYKVLDSDYLVFLVPFFSVGVNLFFIFLLGQNVENQDIIKNPLYHILHDLVGTELGVFIATLLVWSKTREPQESWNNRKSE